MSIGAALVAINTRLSPREIAYILNHSNAKVLVFDSEFAPTVRAVRDEVPGVSLYVQVVDEVPRAGDIPGPEYEEFLASAPEGEHRDPIASEMGRHHRQLHVRHHGHAQGGWQYHARGAYLNALGEVIETGLNWRSVYLWTLPMFHCNGWCHTWAVTAVGGTHVCLRRVDPAEVYRLIEQHGVTNMCGRADGAHRHVLLARRGGGGTSPASPSPPAGAPPAPQVVRTMEGMGANIIHLYGLTETYGPITLCVPQLEWDDMTAEERAFAKTPQGVPYVHAGAGLRVVDEQMNDVPRDGEDDGRGRHALERRDVRLPGRPGRDGEGVRRRLVPLRRPRACGARTARSS